MNSVLQLWIGILLATACAFAQNTVSGRVVDAQGKAVPAAAISLRTADGVRMYATSDPQGRYRISRVRDGVYQIGARSPGLYSKPQTITIASDAEHEIVVSELEA